MRPTSRQVPTVEQIGPRTLRDRLSDPRTVVLDTRAIAAFNGWRQGDDSRGGHIPGAVAFPLAWLDDVAADGIQRLLDDKGVGATRDVALYGDPDQDLDLLLAALAARGLDTVHLLAGGFTAWAADPELPVDRLPRYEALVPPEWLARVVAGERPAAPPAERWVLLHVDFDGSASYALGHLPGAVYLDTIALEEPETWDPRSPDALTAALRDAGITHDTTVVLYGRDSATGADDPAAGRRAGQMAAARALAILRYAGVEDVRLLDGGYDAWVRAGHPVETAVRRPEPVSSFGVPVPTRPDIFVDIAEAKRILADPDDAVLVSVRSWPEQIGAVSGYDHIGAAGRIRGDVWGNAGSDAYHMQHYRNADGTLRAYPEIAAGWAASGITPDKLVAFYCGTGWRASEAWVHAYLQGWPRIAIYDGGWFEWSRDPAANPIETGEPAARSDR